MSNQPQKAVNVTKVFEKFGIPRNLWKTLISGQDDSTKIEKESNEKFSMNPYLKAKTYVAKHSGEMRQDIINYRFLTTEAKMRTDPDIVVDDFSQYSTQMERKIYKILIKTFGVKNYGQKCTICIMNLAQGIIEENKSVDVSAFDNFEVRTLKTYMKIMQEAYVKRVIEIFHLRPEDLDITPEYFCEIGFCNWQSLKKLTSSDTTPESKITAGEAGIGKL